MSKGISVVIPSLGNYENIQRLLQSLFFQKLDQAELQIVVVVNGVSSEDGEAFKSRIKQEYPSVRVVVLHEKGVNKARNAGLKESYYEYILFLDDDCELQYSETIKRYLNLHEKYPDIFAFGGGYLLPEKRGYFDLVYNYIQMNWFVGGQTNSSGELSSTPFLLGGNFCLKRSLAVQQALQFEPSIVYGGSELDFFKQAVNAGLKLAAIDLDVTHHTNETFLSVGAKVFKQGRGKHLIDIKFGMDPVDLHQTGGDYKIIRQLYSYFFWAGYYSVRQQYWKVLALMVRDFVGYFNVLRFKILKKISR